ncbi:expressed unknown protein [Seminavis robusta]|uniref:DUF5898 domain-containing protein n=1 Tax=Seminavis robusta TaxID=568900 RepID=A0A9N8E8R0_9STRA|nr:expressed unknown protein [Seminavis robusta]|eukprot:Sro619_g176400.1 n/a (735) ;mRNA; f:18410-20614
MDTKQELDELIAKAKKDGILMDERIIELCKSMSDAAAAKATFNQYKETCSAAQEGKAAVKEAKVAQEHSVEATYGSTSGYFKQPPLCINTAAQPSNANNGGKDPEEKNKPMAEIIPSNKKNHVPIGEVSIPTTDANDDLIISSLAAKRGRSARRELIYANEAEVQGICLLMIEDALKCLGLSTEEVMPHLEISIYTMRPDILLVLRREGRIIFVIEVKNPEINQGDVFQNQNVAGQIASYLVAMKALGDETPMGAIMTYDKIALVTLADYSGDKSFQKAVEMAERSLTTGRSPTQDHSEKETNCQSRKSTPVKTVVVYSNITKPKDEVVTHVFEEGEDGDGDKKLKLQAHISDVHQGGAVFPFLLQALQIAYLKGNGVKDIVPAVKNGDSIGERLAFKVSKDSFAWCQVRKGVEAKRDVKAFPRSNCGNFYILGKLGQGRSGAVYLVTTTSGIACAMKSYYLKPSNGKAEEDKKRLQEVEEVSKEEADHWQKLYDCRKFSARSLWLGGSPCLLMPYGREVGLDDQSEIDGTRWGVIPAIKAELIRFAKEGFKYHESDLRWGHVLLDQDDKVFFCDLGSLEDSQCAKENPEHVAWEQLKVLIKPMVKNFPLQECLKWVRTSTDKANSIISGEEVLQDLIGTEDGNWAQRWDALFPPDVAADDLSAEATVCLSALWFYKGESETTSATGSPSSEPSRNSGTGASSSSPSLQTESSEYKEDDTDVTEREPKRAKRTP